MEKKDKATFSFLGLLRKIPIKRFIATSSARQAIIVHNEPQLLAHWILIEEVVQLLATMSDDSERCLKFLYAILMDGLEIELRNGFLAFLCVSHKFPFFAVVNKMTFKSFWLMYIHIDTFHLFKPCNQIQCLRHLVKSFWVRYNDLG